MSRAIVWLSVGAWFVLAVLFPRPARAHAVGLSRGEYRIAGSTVRATLVFSGAELATSLPALDADRDGTVAAAELATGRSSLERQVLGATAVRGDGGDCEPHLDGTSLTASDGVQIDAHFECPAPPRVVTIDCDFVDLFGAGHRHLATVIGGRSGGRDEIAIVVASRKRLTVDVAGTTAAGDGSRTSLLAMVWTGVQHIWTGYDHLAFLLGLVLAGGRARTLVGVVSAFTAAHSMTLALAVLHVVTPRASVVEPGIALSIAYVGIENLVVLAPKGWPPLRWRGDVPVQGRWRVTFLFGLLHGFGFAAALLELDLPRSRVAPALFGFNLGVEIGQLAVLAVVLPAIALARREPSFRLWGVRLSSVALTLAGFTWFAARVSLPG